MSHGRRTSAPGIGFSVAPAGGPRAGFRGALLAGGALLALALLAALTMGGPPVQAAYAPAPNGPILCASDRAGRPADPPQGFSRREILAMNPDGRDQRILTNDQTEDFDPMPSPDGRRVTWATRRFGTEEEIVSMNLDGTDFRRLTFSLGEDRPGSYSPDGSRIVFHTGRDGNNFNVYTMNADGSNQTRIIGDPADDALPVWSPDGTRIAFNSSRDDGVAEVYTANPDGSGVVRLTNSPGADGSASWSPDGRQIVFFSARDGNLEIYRMNADGTGQTRLTDDTGVTVPGTSNAPADLNPAWSPDGSKIVFHSNRTADNEVWTINAADGSGLTRLTDNPGFDGRCDWAPVARPAAAPLAPRPPQVTASRVPRTCAARAFRVRVAGDTPPRSVIVTLNGRRIRTTASASFTVRLPARGLRRGVNRLTVTATDAAGNRTERTFRFRACPARTPRFAG